MRVYLAGPIQGCTDAECLDWRAEAKRLLAHEAVDPMDRDFRGRETANANEIVEGDKAAIDGCNALLVFHPRPSTGTDMETMYASDRGKVVVAVVPEGAPLSPWLLYHADGGVYRTVERACAALNRLP